MDQKRLPFRDEIPPPTLVDQKRYLFVMKSVVAESVRLWNHYENLFRLKLSLWCLTLIQVPNSTYQNNQAYDEIGLYA